MKYHWRKAAFGLLSTLLIGSASAATLEISITTKDLVSSEGTAKVTLASTNPLCTKVYFNPMNLVATSPRYKESSVTIRWESANSATVVAEYQGGGFCDYVLDSIDVQFVNGKKYSQWTSFRVAEGKEFGTGFLKDYEILQNRRVVVSTCGRKAVDYYIDCRTTIDGKNRTQGVPAVFYLNRDFLTGQDSIQDVTLAFQLK